MTYNVSSETLNPTTPYYTMLGQEVHQREHGSSWGGYEKFENR